MWRCGDVAMWRCGDVAMWRCFHFFSHTFNSSFRKSFFKTLMAVKTLIVAKNLMAFS